MMDPIPMFNPMLISNSSRSSTSNASDTVVGEEASNNNLLIIHEPLILPGEEVKVKVERDFHIGYTSGANASTSMDIFMRFVSYDQAGNVDASGILGKECFNTWVESRKNKLKNPFLTFVQSVRGHISGSKDVGRNPFDPAVEKSLLVLIRQKKIWPCFEGTPAKYGSRGMKITGFHERKVEQQQKKENMNVHNNSNTNNPNTIQATENDIERELTELLSDDDDDCGNGRKRSASEPAENVFYGGQSLTINYQNTQNNNKRQRFQRRFSSVDFLSIEPVTYPSNFI